MLRVECASVECGDIEPRVIWFGSRRVDVCRVSDRWYGDTQRWWKVETAEGAYIVRLDSSSDTWELAAVLREVAPELRSCPSKQAGSDTH